MDDVTRKTYLLIHGAWHGGWCWREVVANIEKAGHVALAPDLHGSSLASMVRDVCEILAVQQDPVVLVGHSRAGVVISQVAESSSARIERLVYVSGLLLKNGQSALRALREEGSSLLLRHVALSEDKERWVLDDCRVRELFYGNTREAEVEFAQARLTSEPAGPLMTPLKITSEGFGRVARSYVHCLRDAAIPIGLQRRMVAALPCDPVFELDTDHSPFFSAPDELAAHLLSI